MRKLTLLLISIFIIGVGLVSAQTRRVSGEVTSKQDGQSIPGVSILVKGTTLGTVTDMDGKFSIQVEEQAATLIFSFVGMETQEVAVQAGGEMGVKVVMDVSSVAMDEVVVTALGISREKKSLGYSTQSVDAEELSAVPQANLVNAMSGRVSGVKITASNNFGGSSNIVIRGNATISGNNQPLFVVDGVPIDNSTGNSSYQSGGTY